MTTKLALVMGLEYTGTRDYLPGCINDATAIKQMLLQNGYRDENIEMMTDRMSGSNYPTKRNILRQLRSIVRRANSMKADRIWISYSGHGGSTRDRGTDEGDGKDETLYALDGRDILDDSLHRILRRVRKNCHVFGLFDSCHSGTVCDLPYNYRFSDSLELETGTESSTKTRADILTVSGCMDAQNSFSIDAGNKWVGALTQAFLRLVKKSGTSIAYPRIGRFLTRSVTLKLGLPQRPVIASSEQLKRKPIVLL